MPPWEVWIMIAVYIAGAGAILGWNSRDCQGREAETLNIAIAWPFLALAFALCAAILIVLSPFIGLGWLCFMGARAIRGGKGFQRRDS